VLISVLGAGYLGATHAACLASCGHEVVAVDTDPRRVEVLREGRAPFHEPGLDELIGEGLRSGRLRVSDELTDAAPAEVHFVCVGTPMLAASGQADLSALWSLAEALAPLLEAPCLVVGKSTVPVGTAARLEQVLREGSPAGNGVSVAWNPEFLREGRAVEDSLAPERLVIGTDRAEDRQLLREVYADLVGRGVPVIATDLETAELAKVSANAMLATRVSLVNLLAEVCEVSGADVGDLMGILGSDSRIGPHFLRPGLGYGGGCLPKDTLAFVARARELGVDGSTALLEDVDRVNRHQRRRTVALARELVGGPVAGRSVTVLGAAFKAGSDDVRDSPALDVADQLLAEGARVHLYDPQAGPNAGRTCPGLRVAADVTDACTGSELVLVLTEWPEFADLDPVALGEVVARRRVLDARLLLDVDKWSAAGWQVRALGRAPKAGSVLPGSAA
jgi:UDPglucose 6-dehydrogenase